VLMHGSSCGLNNLPITREMKMIRATLMAGFACALALSACDNRGPAEKAGDKIDETVDTIKHGGHESVGNSIKDEVHKAQHKTEDAVDDAKK
jgi:hypothetical protein